MLMEKSTKFNIKINSRDEEGRNAFYLACAGGKPEIVEMLIEKSTQFNIELDTKDNRGQTPLIRACQLGHVAIVGCSGISPEIASWQRETG